MANGRQRDEWSRAAELMSLVYNRTAFGKDAKPTRPIDWIPQALISLPERRAIDDAERKAREAKVTKVPFSVIQELVLGGQHVRK